MNNYCEDCGCKVSGGICSNCQEELYIIENQAEFITQPLSDEFTSKAKEQRKYLILHPQGRPCSVGED